MGKKIFSVGIAELGNSIGQAISNGKIIEMRYASGEQIEEGTYPIKFEIDFVEGRILLTVENPVFDEITEPIVVSINGNLLEKKGLVID